MGTKKRVPTKPLTLGFGLGYIFG